MAKAEFIPAKTETKIVEVEPAQIKLAISTDQAKMLRRLLGDCTSGKQMYDLFEQLVNVLEENNIPHNMQYLEDARSYNDNQLLGTE